jgi:hypothetical protein
MLAYGSFREMYAITAAIIRTLALRVTEHDQLFAFNALSMYLFGQRKYPWRYLGQGAEVLSRHRPLLSFEAGAERRGVPFNDGLG